MTRRIWRSYLTATVIIILTALAGYGRDLDCGSFSALLPAYDLIVVGADPEGIAAAVAAARTGAKALLVDTRPVPGGLFTRGWLNTIDLNLDRAGKPLNGGIFAEIYRQLDDHSFDVDHMATLLRQLIAKEANLDYLAGVLTVLPVVGSETMPLYMPGQTLCPDDRPLPAALTSMQPPVPVPPVLPRELSGIEIHADGGRTAMVSGRCFIDATQDADLAVAAGAGWQPYGQDIWGQPRNMAVTAVFRIIGINDEQWQQMSRELKARNDPDGLIGGTRNSIWGYGYIMQTYQSISDRVRLRALNFGRQRDGSILGNALLLFGFDGLNRNSRLEAGRIAAAELPKILAFLRLKIPQMKDAAAAGIAPELYVRTSRQIVTQYTLTVDDVLENRDFADRVAFGSYPLDIQAQSASQPGDVTGKPEQYAVPLRSLVPAGFANLMVVGRSAGFDSAAQSSARTIPVGMAAGQAAGIAASISIALNLPIEALASNSAAIEQIHHLLADQGVSTGPNPAAPPPETAHWAYEGLRFLRRRGHVSGGYTNSYNLDQPISSRAFANRLVNLWNRLDRPARIKIYELAGSEAAITVASACQVLALARRLADSDSTVVEALPSGEEACKEMAESSLFAAPWPADALAPQFKLSRGGAYMMLFRLPGN